MAQAKADQKAQSLQIDPFQKHDTPPISYGNLSDSLLDLNHNSAEKQTLCWAARPLAAWISVGFPGTRHYLSQLEKPELASIILLNFKIPMVSWT